MGHDEGSHDDGNHDERNHDERNHEGQDWHEAHEEADRGDGYRMRRPTPLTFAAENVMTRTIGCAIAVHRELGPGYLESIYKRAMRIELEACGLSYEAERPVRVVYRGVEIPGQRVDLIVSSLVVVELKSVVRLDRVHTAQVMSYLKTTGLRGGLLINFRVPWLREGLRRIVL
jgi:GxxExxY protein